MLSWLFPVPLFARAHLRRAAGLWLGARLMLALMLLLAEMMGLGSGLSASDLIHGGPDMALYAIFVTATLGLLDTRMRREELFLASLGVSRVRVAVTFAAVALLLEVAVALTWHP